MSYYIFIENGKINGAGQARVLNEEETLTPITSFEVSEDVYNAFVEEPEKYMWDGSNVVENPNYEQEQAIKAKQQRIDEIKAQLTELDQKRIRALCEPSTLTNESNQTWLEYYNNQVLQLREELQSLLGEQ